MSPVLEVERLTATYGGLVAVDRVSFAAEAGSILGVIGPNGAGKSTMLSVLAGSKDPRSGSIRFGGKDIASSPAHRLCWRGICRTHQTPRPFANLTARENVEVARLFGRPATERSTDEVLTLCGLKGLGDLLVEDLRPSELRRLELARAVATDPRVLLVDEVAAGLPSDELESLRGTLTTIRDGGVAMIVVEHVMELVMEVADRVLVLDHGRVIAEGGPDEVVNDPSVIAAYFGEPLDVADDGGTE